MTRREVSRMSDPLAASKKLMQNYLSELLTDEPDAVKQTEQKDAEKEKLDKLLQQVNVVAKENQRAASIATTRSEAERTNQVEEIQEEPVLVTAKSQGQIVKQPVKSYREGAFQAMFFDVAGLQVAVPLIELGGIHLIAETTSLMGKPDWFKGVMLHRDEKINVVDTARWVMPEKCDDKLLDALTYQYVIMLNNSPWGLAAEQLVDTLTLQQEDVKWMESTGKRPWLAGLVKDRMCALLDVDALIDMLNKGANVTAK